MLNIFYLFIWDPYVFLSKVGIPIFCPYFQKGFKKIFFKSSLVLGSEQKWEESTDSP